MSKPYAILSPPYRHNSTGIKALHLLRDSLIAKGYEAKVVVNYSQVADAKYKRPYPEGVDFIAVYTQSIIGNPFKANTVVRYIFRNEKEVMSMGDPFKQFPGEILFTHDLAEKGVDIPPLTFPMIEPYFWYDGTPKDTQCYYVGKAREAYAHRDINVKGFVSIRQDFPKLRIDLAKLLKRSNLLITFDDRTGLILEAQLAGCMVYDYQRNRYFLPEPGIVRQRQIEYRFAKSLDNFIEITQKGSGKNV